MLTAFILSIRDKATPALRRKIEACAPARLNAHIGPRLKRLTQDHFIKLPHNKKGWKPVGFWADAARSTNWQVVPEGVLLSVNKNGVRQRYQGGPIRPGPDKKALTIPVAEEAYGKTVDDFEGQLQLVVIKGKGAWLALKSFEATTSLGRAGRKNIQGPTASRFRERLKFLFRLSAGVDQDADPNVLPTDEEYYAEAIAGAKEAIK